MRVLTPEELLPALCCPVCRADALSATGAGVDCGGCGRSFPRQGEVVDFVALDQLSELNVAEREGNMVDVANPGAIRHESTKAEEDPFLMDTPMRAFRVVARMLAPYEGWTLVSLGSRAGFELKHLLRMLRFERVLSSDIAWTATSIVPTTLEGFEGELGVFASDFDHCPVKRRERQVGLVFEALHHSDDAHGSLDALLERNFDHLVIVEPITNWLVELLARFGLAKRAEYSGVSPEWMSLPRIREAASRRGYSARVVTWWELPLDRFSKRVRRRTWLWRPLFAAVAGASRLLSRFSFGAMAAVHLSREPRPARDAPSAAGAPAAARR